MTVWLWIGFLLLVLALLALDLGVFHRRAHTIGIREATGWTLLWIVLALAFNLALYSMYRHHWLEIGVHLGHPVSGQEAALQFLTGYLLEKSLSLDNIFVMALIFSYFGVPARYQHRVLFWGILGAIVLRGVMIFAGVALIRRFEWIIYVFGGFLVIAAVRMLFIRHEEIHPERNLFVRLTKRFYPVAPGFEGGRFFTSLGGR